MPASPLPSSPNAPPRRWRVTVLRLAVLVVVLVALNAGGHWAMGWVESRFMPLYEAYGAVALFGAVGLYVVAMALPFVPGMEISVALIVLFGARGAVLVYGATLLALCLSYLAGRRVPAGVIAGLFGWLRLHRARVLVQRLAPLPPDARLRLLLEAAPARLVPFLLRHRYLALAVAFNTPGNSLIGGGGGIALVAGLSGLYRGPRFVLLVALAIAPIPALVVLTALLRGT